MTTTNDGSVPAAIAAPASQDLTIASYPIARIKPHPRNARTHTRSQIRQIAQSIKTFRWTFPILLDGNDRIIAGHARFEAAKLLGLTEVPIIRRSDMTEAQLRAYCIADNKLAERAGWDTALLKLEFEEILKLDSEFDLTVTGIELGELDVILDAGSDPAADAIPEIDPKTPPVTRPGDLWLLGKHRLLCGDARNAESYARLMDRKRAQMVFTDPPYNVPIDGYTGGLGQIHHDDFAMARGEMSEPEFIAFLDSALGHLVQHSVEGSIHFVCMDWGHIYELLTAGRNRYQELKNVCVWNKTNGGMGTFYRSKHELVLVFKKGTAAHINNFELGQHGRHRTNVWDYAGVNTLKPDRMAELKMHPTVKPVALVADAIRDCSKRNGIILDPFAGSGTTAIAAEQAGRLCYALELDPRYVDTAVHRWEKVAGDSAIHADTGKSFAETAAARGADPMAVASNGL